MIRVLEEKDVDTVAKIWLETNIKTHDFIASNYWKEHHEIIKDMFLQAEIYVYEIEKEIMGFIGLDKEYIEGIFVLDQYQKRGIGKALLNHVKARKEHLSLNVYQKNLNAIFFYQREGFCVQYEDVDENTGEKEYRMVWNRLGSNLQNEGNLL
ncbi:N-acetyltransferase [Faecalitalea cylindroides]|uniref:N-acetyltransferase n=1 Tax=Faecalitalea cylindroides TaxID=39483 RepID=UPI00189A8210|nr:N-acetyltransferase [Faecalitalea cylindroides]MDB7946792.1 N-acetyltransferase [Faecalitalea cylindroides]MDB7948709.1 N-acetyltransferase [Faecalitalea cylindroides]MDB7950627.1 N-acetyltransferase [Faecalitalea cylindroides]